MISDERSSENVGDSGEIKVFAKLVINYFNNILNYNKTTETTISGHSKPKVISGTNSQISWGAKFFMA